MQRVLAPAAVVGGILALTQGFRREAIPFWAAFALITGYSVWTNRRHTHA